MRVLAAGAADAEERQLRGLVLVVDFEAVPPFFLFFFFFARIGRINPEKPKKNISSLHLTSRMSRDNMVVLC